MVKIKVRPVRDINYVGYFSDRDKIGTYLKEKINGFKETMLVVIEKIEDYSSDVEDKVDEFVGKVMDPVIDYFDDMKLKQELREKEKEQEERYRKVMNLMTNNDLASEERITKMKEFKKELLMDNFESEDVKKNKR